MQNSKSSKIVIKESNTRLNKSKIIIPINYFSSIDYNDSTGRLTIYYEDTMLTKTIAEDSLSISKDSEFIIIEYQQNYDYENQENK